MSHVHIDGPWSGSLIFGRGRGLQPGLDFFLSDKSPITEKVFD